MVSDKIIRISFVGGGFQTRPLQPANIRAILQKQSNRVNQFGTARYIQFGHQVHCSDNQQLMEKSGPPMDFDGAAGEKYHLTPEMRAAQAG
jgi:hypothetical protein